MNRQQLYSYCRRIQKKQSEILPGQTGIVFLKTLRRIADGDTDAAKVWPDLMQDTERILKLIRANRNLDQKVWLAALPRLEAQQDYCFKTETGMAFITALKEKPGICLPEKRQGHHAEASSVNTVRTAIRDDERELEKVAVWLRGDPSGQKENVKKKKAVFFSGCIRQAAIPAFACLSVCCLAIWLYGQAGRNMDRWNLQQMKISAVQKTDVFMKEKPGAKAEIVSRTEKLKDAGQLVKKAKIQNKPQIKKHPEKLAQYREMSEAYSRLYGWLQIPETQIDLSVMRAEGDREFYLHHDFTGAESAEGALFVDAKSSIYPQDDNTVIYGHNMKNGHIFGTLKMYLDQEFFQAHREIRFDTLYESGIYEAVAVLKTRILNENENGFRYYHFFQYKNKEEFQDRMDFVEENRMFETGSTLQYGDGILMLSTCEYSQENGRLVVVARKTGSAQ